jgi:hypothetical protein
LFSFDRTAGKLRELASYTPDSTGHEVAGPDVQPHVNGDLVVWSAVSKRPPVGTHLDAFAVSAAGGTPRIVAEDAANATLFGDEVYVQKRLSVADQQPPTTQIERVDLRTGAAAGIGTKGTDLGYLAAGPLGVVWKQNGSLEMFAPSEPGSKAIVGAVGELQQPPVVGNDFVAWADRDGTKLWSSRLHRTLSLGYRPLASFAAAAGPFVLWNTSKDPSRVPSNDVLLDLLDTRTLD